MLEPMDKNPQPEAVAWLMEMELVGNPTVLNNLILNILVGIPGVKDANLVVDTNNKKILIFLVLSWFSAKFKSKAIAVQVNDIISQVLPAWRLRVVFDRTILEKALKLITSDRILQ